MVVATDNPIEFEGTFPLPEAQLDRFLLRVSLGYPTPEEEREILSRLEKEHPIETLQQVVSPEEINRFKQAARAVYVEDSLRAYIVELVSRTRRHSALAMGASPRGSIALFQAARIAVGFARADLRSSGRHQIFGPLCVGPPFNLDPGSAGPGGKGPEDQTDHQFDPCPHGGDYECVGALAY